MKYLMHKHVRIFWKENLCDSLCDKNVKFEGFWEETSHNYYPG